MTRTKAHANDRKHKDRRRQSGCTSSMYDRSWSKGRNLVRRGSLLKVEKRSSGRQFSINSRRELIKCQARLDRHVFDSNLGCPLGSYEDATLNLVGGKALQCWRLIRHGLPIPPSFVVPTYAYSQHLDRAGAAELVAEVFSSNLKHPSIRKATKEKLDVIRLRILETPLQSEVVSNLATFMESLGKGVEVAVRSSGTAEDLTSKSFAGQYDSFLYKSTPSEVCNAIKACWASMFNPHILNYAEDLRAVDAGVGEKPAYQSGARNMRPQMGVLVMKMVEAETSGVCFTENIWGAKNESMIEAVLGQGEGLVSGALTADRYVIDKITTNLRYQELHNPTHKFVRSSNMDGVEKIALMEKVEGPILDMKSLRAITDMAKQVEDYYQNPQDIEWAIDVDGALHLLQARPITAIDRNEILSFTPPGEGLWSSDPTHFPRPVSPWLQDCYKLSYCTERSRRTGCLIEDITVRFVNQIFYTQPKVVAPSPALERAAQAYWTKRLYEDDYREFCDFFRPKCEMLQAELRETNPSLLSYESLVSYVDCCFEYASEFWKLHHTFTTPATVIVGDYMNRMSALTGKDVMETLCLLKSSSPESRGLLNRDDPLLFEMYELLNESSEAMGLLQYESDDASWALDCLLHMPGRLGEVMRKVSLRYGWRLAGHYDLVTSALIETPEFFLKTIYNGTKEDPNAARIMEQQVREVADAWKNELPKEKHNEFEEILELGQKYFRLRDERGLCTDLSGVGLCRRGILEGGRRLVEQGRIHRAEHLCVARKDEAVALLRGEIRLRSCKEREGPWVVPTPQELKNRFEYITSADPTCIPRSLGIAPTAVDTDLSLPPGIRRTMDAVETGMKEIFHRYVAVDNEEDGTDVCNTVRGVSASGGIAEGPCCVVINEKDLQKVKKGDIVVTYSCSASFNVVIGLCAGICTDYGGILSHAAIVAREYGIPAVVGTQSATKAFKDGDILCVDCYTSTVRKVSGNIES